MDLVQVPGTMAADCGRCVWTRDEVSPGQVAKYLVLISFVHLERAVYPVAVCKKAMQLSVQETVEVLHIAAGSVVMFTIG